MESIECTYFFDENEQWKARFDLKKEIFIEKQYVPSTKEGHMKKK